LPALLLLDRLPTAVLGVGPHGIVLWNHANDYVIRTKVSPRLLLVSITDLTEWYWESTNGHSP
jgi:hypothetical protein